MTSWYGPRARNILAPHRARRSRNDDSAPRQGGRTQATESPGSPETRLPESFLLGEEQNRRYGTVGHDAGLGYCGREGHTCLLYTSDAADDLLCVDLGGRRIIKKKKKKKKKKNLEK